MANLRVNPQTNEVLNEAGEVVGQLVTQVEHNPGVVAKDIAKVEAYASKQGGWLSESTRTVEKLIAYGAALVAATNGFAQLNMPSNVRVGLMAVASAVIAAQHLNSKNN